MIEHEKQDREEEAERQYQSYGNQSHGNGGGSGGGNRGGRRASRDQLETMVIAQQQQMALMMKMLKQGGGSAGSGSHSGSDGGVDRSRPAAIAPFNPKDRGNHSGPAKFEKKQRGES